MSEVLLNRISLRQARTQLMLRQWQLSKRAHVSVPTIVSAEQGDTIRMLTAQALLNALNEVRQERGLESLDISDLSWNVQGD